MGNPEKAGKCKISGAMKKEIEAICKQLEKAVRQLRKMADASASTKTKPRKPSAAFMKPMTPSAELAAVVGSKPLPRTEVTKKLWAYIKNNRLQDKKNRRNINADATLKAVFGGKTCVNMFEMTKLISKHLS